MLTVKSALLAGIPARQTDGPWWCPSYKTRFLFVLAQFYVNVLCLLLPIVCKYHKGHDLFK